MSTVTENLYLTVAETAALLRVDPRTIRNWIKAGKLRAKQVPGSKGMRIAGPEALGLLQDVPVRGAASGVGGAAVASPLIDRLATPQGRGRAIAALRALREDAASEEERVDRRETLELLENARETAPVEFRRWNTDEFAAEPISAAEEAGA